LDGVDSFTAPFVLLFVSSFMGHHLAAFIARPAVLTGLAPLLPGARMHPLGQGLWFAPVPGELRDRAMEVANDDSGGPGPHFYELVAVLDVIGAELSKGGDVGWMESDWFGGIGSSYGRLWRAGAVVIEEDGVNAILRALGAVCLPERLEIVEQSILLRAFRWFGAEPIKPRLMDEWDSVGLGGYRNTEKWYELGKAVESYRGE
jgi:hypothetical protein